MYAYHPLYPLPVTLAVYKSHGQEHFTLYFIIISGSAMILCWAAVIRAACSGGEDTELWLALEAASVRVSYELEFQVYHITPNAY